MNSAKKTTARDTATDATFDSRPCLVEQEVAVGRSIGDLLAIGERITATFPGDPKGVRLVLGIEVDDPTRLASDVTDPDELARAISDALRALLGTTADQMFDGIRRSFGMSRLQVVRLSDGPDRHARH